MIARLWTARAPLEHQTAYRAHFEERVLPGLRTIAGYAGAALLNRLDGDSVDIVVITWWTSLDAIRGFAGADVERAVVADAVRPLLAAWDERVRHYDVVLSDR